MRNMKTMNFRDMMFVLFMKTILYGIVLIIMLLVLHTCSETPAQSVPASLTKTYINV